jgi:hypothetical protein
MPINHDIEPIADAEINDCINKLQGFDSNLSMLINLSPLEKQKHRSVKNKLQPFVEKIALHASLNPSIIPTFVSLTNLNKKINNQQQLKRLETVLVSLLEKVQDTAHNEGHLAYKEAIKIFETIQIAAQSNVLGIDEIYDDVKVFFKKSIRKPKNIIPE